MSDAIDYPQRLENALLWMVGDLLRDVAKDGLPGEHHFLITFRTDADGVEMPEQLRELYPEEMTIVLQHRFWDLAVEEDRFAVTLAFDGRKQQLGIPFSALRAFLDPSVTFGLRFGSAGEAEVVLDEGAAEGGADADPARSDSPSEPSGDEANVLSFERPRKR